jgi:hypothetical protein
MRQARELRHLAAAVLLAWAAPAAAQRPLDLIGHVKSVRISRPDDIVIVRPAGATDARADLDLYAGDRLRIRTGAKLCANLEGREKCFDHEDNGTRLSGRGRGGASAEDDGFLLGLRILFGNPRKAIALFLQAQGPESASRLAASALAPAGTQYLPAESRRVALVWEGGPSALQIVSRQGEAASLPAGNVANAIASLPEGPGPYAVRTVNPALSWTIERREQIPSPPWFERGRPLSPARRIVRALWILRCGPGTWRVFALGELARLAEEGDYLASQYWHAARSGELAGAQCGSAP